jgi:hypothetical protein
MPLSVPVSLTRCLHLPPADFTLLCPSFVAKQEDAAAAQAATAVSDAAATGDLVVTDGTAGVQSAAAEEPTNASAEVCSCEATFDAKAMPHTRAVRKNRELHGVRSQSTM